MDTGIYMITSPSGKRYVGSAVSFERRWKLHLRQLRAGTHHSKALQRAFLKYGEEALSFSKLALCSATDLLSTEQQFLDSMKPEYNSCPIAGSKLGMVCGPQSPEHRAKIGAAHRGKLVSEATRIQLGNAHRGKVASVELRQRLSAIHAGANNHFFGKTHTAETLEKMSGDAHHSSRAVLCVETGDRFGSMKAAQEWLQANGKPKASRSPIMSCCKGSPRYSKAYGYTWRFE